MLEGRLVNLRPRDLTDTESNYRWFADMEFLRLMGDRYPQSTAFVEKTVREWATTPMTFTDPRFTIETKAGEIIGRLRLFMVEHESRSARLAIGIGERAYWSNGYGSDALRVILRFAFDEMNLHRVELDVFAFNERAIACYRKVGFVEEARLRQSQYADGKLHDVFLMAMLRDEWTERAD